MSWEGRIEWRGQACVGGVCTRPKSAVSLADGRLGLAKFSKPDDMRDIAGGEILALTLTAEAGIRVLEHRLMPAGKHSVAVITRFDRVGSDRILSVSGARVLGLPQGEPGAYTLLADAIRQFGEDVADGDGHTDRVGLALAPLAVSTMLAAVRPRYAWLWDVDLDAEAFDAVISGQGAIPLEQRQWAVLRLIEYAPYSEIRRLLPRDFFIEHWPTLASRVRSRTRREGMAFLHDWYRQPLLGHG